VLKPGGHMLAFAGTRTQHRMAVRIEDAGFEIRDMIAWVYGSGFPKSLDVSKAIDKAAGAEREVVGTYKGASNIGKGSTNSYITTESGTATDVFITAPATEAAKQWQGWGTALKPAWEPICLARKPLIGTVAANVLAHGTGAINVDGARIPVDLSIDDPRLGGKGAWTTSVEQGGHTVSLPRGEVGSSALGRWPANILHDGAIEGEVGRYFYTAKADADDRIGSLHPTVKPRDPKSAKQKKMARLIAEFYKKALPILAKEKPANGFLMRGIAHQPDIPLFAERVVFL
jgi:site-specific DNA-methyltransferase (adenine-specific)